MQPEIVYLSLGSNLGDRRRNLQQALLAIRTLPGLSDTRCSPIYESDAWGNPDQGPFLNCVVESTVSCDPPALLERLHLIESDLGRTRGEHWGPRAIDIDLLLFGEQQIESEDLTIPHPLMLLRRFVLLPLSDLAPDLLIPGTGMRVNFALEVCPDKLSVAALQLEHT